MHIKKIIIACLLHVMLPLHPKTAATGVPKSGATTLLATVLKELMHTKRYAGIKGDMELAEQQMQTNDLLIGTPVYNEHNVALIEKYNAKIIHIVRDPRDLISAMGKKIYNFRKLIAAARNKNSNQIISEIITGGAPFYSYLYAFDKVQNVKGINDLYAFWLPWIEHPNTLTVRFEDLSGANGQHKQKETICKIAQFLNIPCDQKKAHAIATKLQGGGFFGLFKKSPSVGAWQKTFTPEHKQLCKQIAGQLIIDLNYAHNNNW
jgi:hypothetical protein